MPLLDQIVPLRLGRPYRWLLASSWVSNLADGVAIAAGPLLVAAQTDDEALVALAFGIQLLPQLLFGLPAGAAADRLDRRRLVLVGNLVRVVVLAVLVTAVLTDAVSIWLVLVTLFVLGIAETFVDTTAVTLTPMLVARVDLGIANARSMTGLVTMNQMAGPPIGAGLFALGAAWPFVGQALLLLAAAGLILRMQLPALDRSEPVRRVRSEIADGLRWLWRHPPVRTLTLTIFTFNITYGAAYSVLVLYATQRLDLGAVGFGLISTVFAVGGLCGTLSYGWLERHLSLATIMRIGLVIETLTHLVLALTTSPWVALPVFFVFGAHAFVWGTTSTVVRQRAVPAGFQGRVGSVYRLGMVGGIVIGSALAAPIAQSWGVTGPFWFAFVGSAVILVAIWRHLVHIAHAEAD